MKRKYLIVLLSAILLFAIVASFAACDSVESDPQPTDDVFDAEEDYSDVTPARIEFRREGDADEFTPEGLILTGKNLKRVSVTTDNNGWYILAVEFDEEGTEAFASATAELIGQRIYIWIDDELIVSPTVNVEIPDGKAVLISAEWANDYDKARKLARSLMAGALLARKEAAA